MATLLTKKSDTASSVPTAGALTNSTGGAELAVNTADKRLFTKDSGGNVVELGTNPSTFSLPNGTANGIPYLNGSKVLTSGSALTFDGTNFYNGLTSAVSGWTGIGRSVWNKQSNTNSVGFVSIASASDAGIFMGHTGSIGVLGVTYGASAGYTPLTFWTNDTEQMRLTSTGLGIGTSSPGAKLDVSGNLRFSAANPVIELNNGGAQIYSTVANTLQFASGGGIGSPTERARIDSSGNLLVGTTSVIGSNTTQYTGTSQAVVAGYASNASFTNAVILARMAGTSTSAQLFIGQNNNNSAVFYARGDGAIFSTSTSITAISDQTLKTNVRDLDTGLSEVLALKPRRFDWMEGEGQNTQNVAGFIAQEVEQVLPELVDDYVYKVDEENGNLIKKSLKMGDMLPTLVKAIQEQQAIIESLKARLDAANL